MPTTHPWLNPPADGRRFAAALAAGLLLEAAALMLLIPVMTHQEAPSETPAPIKLSIVAPAPAPKPPTPPPPKPLPPLPVIPAPPTPPPPPLPVAPPMLPPPPVARPAQHIRHYEPPHPPPPVTPPDITPPQPQTPPPPPTPPAPTGGQVDAFAAAMKRALQAHANEVYPQAAQLAHETGAPELTFTYLNGQVSNITISRSSGFPMLDQAALECARISTYPAPPKGFEGRTYRITVSVDFRLGGEDFSGD